MEKQAPLKVNGGYPIHSFDDVKSLYFVYISDPKAREMIEQAYLFAKEKHEGQFRKSGEPYIQHPIEVAYILASLTAGPETIAAGLLHDVVEDTGTPIEEIKDRFGSDVAKIVNSLTKIQRLKLSHRSEEDFEAEDHRKIFLGMAKDVRVIIVKLADRLHNLRTLDSLSPERKKAIANETLEVFTPIAHRLGIYTMQSEMEDLSLKYKDPVHYNEILNLLNKKTSDRKGSLEALKKRIADILFEHHIPFRMESRVKSIYSIYRKMYQKGHNFEDIYDVLAVRIITQSEMNCYEILGIIHSTYKPIPGRFKDYIAMPKPNMYQSLHTSIISGDGNVYEVQIRTEEMDSIAETGVAAHWKYKEGGRSAKEEQKDIEAKLHWFRDFVSISGENKKGDAREYIDTLTSDVFNANVYVFTPLGRVINLPTGATALDFAYKVHTKVGDSAVGATVNGAIVPLNTVLKTGDICEIRTSSMSTGPKEGWLEIAKTSSAKAHIRRALQKKRNEETRDEREDKGKQLLLEAFKDAGYGEEDAIKLVSEEKVLKEYNCKDLKELYVKVSVKNPSASTILSFLKIRRKPGTYKVMGHSKSQDDKNPVVVPGASNVMVSLGKCCSPIPGDHIVGYVSKGKGIIVHRVNCPNVKNLTKRLVEVHWKEDLGVFTYPVDIELCANDRPNLLADILGVLSSKSIAVSDLKAHLIQETLCDVINLTVYVPSAKTLEDTFAQLLGLKGVYSAERLIH